MTIPRFFLRAIAATTTLLSLVTAAPAAAATVTIGWDASSSANVTGYEVCASFTTTCAGGVSSIGNQLQWTFQGLADNRQYYLLVRATNAGGISAWAQIAYASPVLPPAGSERTRSDFNGDAWADIIWQSNASGRVATWHMNGSTFLTSRFLSDTPPPGWKAVGSGDLNRDGKPDLIGMHETSGDLAYWLMDGTLMYASGGFSVARVDTSWNLVSVRDMNLDGSPDFVWHNVVNGQLAVWYMSGAAVIQGVLMNPGQVGDTNWKARATADFTGDGWPDLLWLNETTGQLVVWEMRGHTFVASHDLNPGSVDPSWKLGAVADANRDGWPDIVWHHEPTGTLILWSMVGNTMGGWSFLNVTLTDPDWQMAGPR